MKIYLLSFLIFSLALSSCNSGAKTSGQPEETAALEQAESELWDKVMGMHDVVMPKMGELNRLARQLKAVETIPADLEKQVQSSLSNLDQAGEGMMAWMAGFKQLENLRNNMSHKEIMSYLGAEQTKIEGVKQSMESSITAAKELLEKLQ